MVLGLVMLSLLAVASIAIDVGQILAVRSDLQNTADSAAKAAAQALIKEDSTYTNRTVVRDASAAYDAAMDIIQKAAIHNGFTWDPANPGYDISIIFANYKDHATSSQWTLMGEMGDKSEVASNSNANAVQVVLKRASGKTYGPVTNFFAGIFGKTTTEVAVSAKAYMGYTTSVYKGTVTVPLALPASGATNPLAYQGKSGWWDRMVGPNEAVAAAPSTKPIEFRDSGGYYNPQNPNGAPTNIPANVPSVGTLSSLDPGQIYFFTVGSSDAVPTSMKDIMEKIYTPSKTGSILYVDKLALAQRIYPRSEYCWGKSYISPLFERLQKAYYYKTTGSSTTAPAAGTPPWRVTVPVYSVKANPLVTSSKRTDGLRNLARLLRPWPTEALACCTVTAPIIYVNGFANADIVGVTYSSSCDDCNYTYPKTIDSPEPLSGTTTYTSKKDCLTRYPDSTWNKNYAKIQGVTSVSTIIPGTSTTYANYGNVSGEGGGLSNKEMNSAAPEDVGAFAKIPKIIR